MSMTVEQPIPTTFEIDGNDQLLNQLVHAWSLVFQDELSYLFAGRSPSRGTWIVVRIMRARIPAETRRSYSNTRISHRWYRWRSLETIDHTDRRRTLSPMDHWIRHRWSRWPTIGWSSCDACATERVDEGESSDRQREPPGLSKRGW